MLTTIGKLDWVHSGGKEENIWNIGDPLGHLLVSPCFTIKVNGKLQQLNLGKTSNGPDPSGMKVWATESKWTVNACNKVAVTSWGACWRQGDMEWVVEEGSYKYQLPLVMCYRNEDCNCHENSSLFCYEHVCVWQVKLTIITLFMFSCSEWHRFPWL